MILVDYMTGVYIEMDDKLVGYIWIIDLWIYIYIYISSIYVYIYIFLSLEWSGQWDMVYYAQLPV